MHPRHSRDLAYPVIAWHDVIETERIEQLPLILVEPPHHRQPPVASPLGAELGFEHEHEAKAFLQDLHERLRAFELALHPDKTRLIRFGRHAAAQRARLGEVKPETFDFLGFTHFCTRSRKWGSFVIGRKTIKKRMRAKLKAIKVELRKVMHDPIAKTGAWVKQML